MSIEKKILTPSRLVMIESICNVCGSSQGPTRSIYINTQYICRDHIGFIVCHDNEECYKIINEYMKSIHDELYNNPLWNKVLNRVLFNIPVNIKRASGDIESEWYIQTKQNPDINIFRANIITFILSCNLLNDYLNSHKSPYKLFISFDIIKYIINFYIKLCSSIYENDIYKLCELVNNDNDYGTDKIISVIKVHKGDLSKFVPIEELFKY